MFTLYVIIIEPKCNILKAKIILVQFTIIIWQPIEVYFRLSKYCEFFMKFFAVINKNFVYTPI